MRAARFKVSGTLLREALQIDDSYVGRFLEAHCDFTTDTIEFVLEVYSLPEGITDCEPTVTKERTKWEWNPK